MVLGLFLVLMWTSMVIQSFCMRRELSHYTYYESGV